VQAVSVQWNAELGFALQVTVGSDEVNLIISVVENFCLCVQTFKMAVTKFDRGDIFHWISMESLLKVTLTKKRSCWQK